jgi:hypothetical protein
MMNILPQRIGNHDGKDSLLALENPSPLDAPIVQKTAKAKNGMPNRKVVDDFSANAAGRGC